MPELPEVEALALDLKGRLDGHAIATVHIAQFSALKTFDPPLRALEGLLVDDVGRHGKFLDLSVGGLHLVVHLARGGWIRWKDEVPTLPPRPGGRNPLAARVVLDDQSGLDITEAGTKKRLAIYLVRDPQDVPGIATLGPDPLTDDFTLERFRGILAAEGRKQIKGVLRHQGTIAGIGNAYSDEILHAAQLSPVKLTHALSDDEIARLFDATRSVLQYWLQLLQEETGDAFPEKVTAFRPGMAVHGRYGKPCPRCGAPIQRIVYARNESNYCAACQTGGRLLADRALSRLLRDDWPKTLEDLERARRR